MPVAPVGMIATDVDHTLLSDRWRIGRSSRAAIRRAADEGIAIVLASGRMPAALDPIAEQLALDGAYLIAYNGALVRRAADRRPIWSCPISPGSATRVLRRAAEQGLARMLFVGEELFVDQMDAVVDAYQNRTGVPVRPLQSEEQLLVSGLSKVIVYEPTAEAAGVTSGENETRLLSRMSGCPGVQAFGTGYGQVELGSAEASKLRAIDVLASRRGLGRENVAAIGDGENDVEMIRHCGLGFAVANACRAALDAADVVVGSNNDDGVGEAVEQVLARRT